MSISRQNIIIINGSGGCGKSTFIKKCAELTEANDFGVQLPDNETVNTIELSTVDWPKAVAQFAGWTGGKTDKDRAFLHDLKMALEAWDNSPNQKVFDQINSLKNGELTKSMNFLFFVNIREPYNISRFIEQNSVTTGVPCHTLLVYNNNVEKITTNDADASVDKYKYDFYVDNSYDLERLKNNARAFLREFFWIYA